MKTEIEFLQQIKREFATADYGEGISFNLNGIVRTINNRIEQVKKLSEVNVSRCNFFQGSKELWQEHHREGSVRLQNLLIAKGFTSCSIGEAEELWMSYSDKYAAGFLGMPDTDEELYEYIKDQLCVVERNYIG